jgi:hypothetical protein
VKPSSGSVDLYWLPLGAGGQSVRLNGRVFEALAALREHRPSRDLYHSALEIRVDDQRFVVEMTPAWGSTQPQRGVVREGPVGLAWLGRSKFFRYEVRCWSGGAIPDVALAVGGPLRLVDDLQTAVRLIELVPAVPPLTWGRDELGSGEMWNSNSLVAWLLAKSGLDAEQIQPPRGGRAPGWRSGLVLAEKQERSSQASSA